MIEQIMPLAEMLYDIRCWKDDVDRMPLPDVESAGNATTELDFVQPLARRACLLFSGGKDSSLSAVVLRKKQLGRLSWREQRRAAPHGESKGVHG